MSLFVSRLLSCFLGGGGGGGGLSHRGELGRQELKLTKVAVTGSKQ